MNLQKVLLKGCQHLGMLKPGNLAATFSSPDKYLNNHITIPNHNPIRIGTLSDILKEIATHLDMSKEELIKKIFS
jgi:hypothetical protein